MPVTDSSPPVGIVRFVLDGRTVSVEQPLPTLTVLDYLRDTAGRCGTKEGCAEGDCGACTVVVGELAENETTVRYRAVNSCIRFLPTLDGKELVTVESLADAPERLHPVQRSMVDNHASQCGFCTPGFVMSLFALYLDRPAASREQVVDALAGNLCRCTGYRPIIAAGLAQWSYPQAERWQRDAGKSPARLAALQAIARKDGAGSLRYPGFHAPRSVEELATALAEEPDALLLAGGTDIGLWVTKQLRELPTLVHLGEVPELRQMRETPDELWVGAAVPITDAWPALLRRFPALAEQAARFASPPIRNSATLCGNVGNGSPIGDSIPLLIALDAQLELRCGNRTRTLALEDLYLGYQKKALAPSEFITGIRIPAPHEGQVVGSFKLAKRTEQDISAVSATFSITLDGERLVAARLAYGGMAAIACRARNAEAALLQAGWSGQGIEAAIAALPQDFTPLSDMRASGAYRLRTAGNLLRRFHLQQSGGDCALRTADALLEVATS